MSFKDTVGDLKDRAQDVWSHDEAHVAAAIVFLLIGIFLVFSGRAFARKVFSFAGAAACASGAFVALKNFEFSVILTVFFSILFVFVWIEKNTTDVTLQP